VLRLGDYCRHLASLCLAHEPGAADLSALGGDAARWERYRRMVRRRVEDSIAAVFPRLRAAAGQACFDAVVDAFFASRGLASPFIRDVPGELLAFVCLRAEAFGLPPHAVELARLEWAEREVLYAEDDVAAAEPLAMSRPVALTRAFRLLAMRHAVHEFDADEARPPAARAMFYCVYRDPETHEAKLLTVSAVAHALLEELSAEAPLEEAIRRAAARTDAALDRAFMESLSELLADLSARGVVRGASPTDPARRR
jgi:hypothetical protein